ncbi:MAG: CxxxxCH/CxxCH domain-containing protein [Deltaproteobacteria bacterium]|nr:CxxxxCH/CxxCH domain-containing protein [Deltaproteobacteria bacterium]
MKKIICSSLVMLGCAAGPQIGFANTAPHWSANNIDCIDCHQNHMGPKTACEFCHNNTTGAGYSKTSAPAMATHSAAIIGSGNYGEWARQCVDCHDPHVSAQCSTPLVEGTFTSYSSAAGFTTFQLGALVVHDISWQAPASWAAKTGAERGLVLLVQGLLWDAEQNKYVDFSSEIVSATPTAITVSGEVSAISTVRDFKILYGQYIRTAINGRPVDFPGTPAGLAENEGTGAIDPTPTGICQVCHTQTAHWRSDGTLADHFNGENCTGCHEHELGFRPSCNACHGFPPVAHTPGEVNGLVWNPAPTGASSAGAHRVHAIDNGISCETCHSGGMPVTPIVDDYRIQLGFAIAGQESTGNSYDGQHLSPPYIYEATNNTMITTGGSMTCTVYCHSDGTSVATGIPGGQTSPSWTLGSTDCNSCHAYPPAYGQDQPKSNSHQRHINAGFTCSTCHYGTTTDGATIAATGNHGNGRYDVIGAPTFRANGQDLALDLVYEFDAGGGTCSTNSCHGYFGFNTPIRWGKIYLYASPSFSMGDESNEIDFQVNVTRCGDEQYDCALPFTCSFTWGDGSETSGSCTTSHIYPAPGDYQITWNVWDANRHSMENDKTTAVTVEEVAPPAGVTLGATFDPDSGLVTVTVPDTTTAGVPVARVYVYWGDRLNTIISPPIGPVTHRYARNSTYRIRVVVYDIYHSMMTYTYLEEPSLEVTVVNP